MVCQHCDAPCWLKEDPCAMAEMKARMEGEATMERDSLEAFFLRLLLLDNIKQEAQVPNNQPWSKVEIWEDVLLVLMTDKYHDPIACW